MTVILLTDEKPEHLTETTLPSVAGELSMPVKIAVESTSVTLTPGRYMNLLLTAHLPSTEESKSGHTPQDEKSLQWLMFQRQFTT